MANQVKDQFKPIFGSLFEMLSKAPDWDSINTSEKAGRLEGAYREQCKGYGRPDYTNGGSLYEHAIQCLELPD